MTVGCVLYEFAKFFLCVESAVTYGVEGLALANGIVDLVCRVIRPTPVVVAPPATTVVTQPVVTTPVVTTPVVTAPAATVVTQPVVITQPAVPQVVVAPPVYYTRPAPPPPPHRPHHRPAPPRHGRGGRR